MQKFPYQYRIYLVSEFDADLGLTYNNYINNQQRSEQSI